MISGKKPPIMDLNFGREPRIDDARAHGADGGAGERDDGDGDGGPSADDRAAGYDGAASALLGWAGPGLSAPAYAEGLCCDTLTSIQENRTRTISAAQAVPLTEDGRG